MTHRATPYFRRFALGLTCVLLIFIGLSGATSTTHAQTRAYVSNANDSTISVIDPATNTVIATIPVGFNTRAIAFTPDGSQAYVTSFPNAVLVVETETNTVIATVA